MKLRLFLPVAFALGLLYVFVTPPFMVPDESAHFWRSIALAQGNSLLADRPVLQTIFVEDRLGVLFWHVSQTLYRTGKYRLADLRVSSELVLDGVRQRVGFISIYTPVPYVPQALSVVATLSVSARPIVVFYAGRLTNFCVALALIAMAIRLAPQAGILFAAVAVLPMTLHQLASWSADAAAIAFAFVFTAITVRALSGSVARREHAGLIATAVLLGLCKPVYFLLTLLVLFVPGRQFQSRRHRAIVCGSVLIAAAIAAWISMLYFDRGFFNMRTHLPVSPQSQIQCMVRDPLHYLAVLGDEIARNGRFYIEGSIGRFGMYDVKLHPGAIVLGLVVLVAGAISARPRLTIAFRVAAVVIFAATVLGIATSQYLIWSPACGDIIEGVQGRYFLPMMPLILIALSGHSKWGPRPVMFLSIAVGCNLAALATLVTHFWL